MVDLRPILWTSTAIIAGIVGTLIFMASAQRRANEAFSDLGLSMESFLRVSEGMSKSEVSSVLDAEPKLVASVGTQATYVWQQGPRVVGAVFEKDCLIGKWQSGL